MEYTTLTKEARVDILTGRLKMLEEHHYRLSLDIQDAERHEDGETLAACLAKREVLEDQVCQAVSELRTMSTEEK